MSVKVGQVSVEDYAAVVSEFGKNLMDGKLIGKRCKVCGKKYFPPRKGCEDLHTDLEDYEIQPEAILKAYTVIHFAPDNMADKAPYVVAIGEIEPGLRVLAHLVGLMKKPTVGMKIKLKPQKVSDDRVTYKFVPA